MPIVCSPPSICRSIVSGKARSRQLNIQRSQVLGSLSHFKSGWGGNHNFKVGGEFFRETSTPQEFAAQIASEFEVYRKVVYQQRLTLE